jgi:GNAT superfamily N-acetyltransferase
VDRSQTGGTLSAVPSETSGVNDETRETLREHWAALLDCAPEAVFAPDCSIVASDTDAVELLSHPDGVTVAGPAAVTSSLRSVLADRPLDVTPASARTVVETALDRASVGEARSVSEVLGPQFVAYCDASTFTPVHDASSPVGAVDPASLEPLREAVPPEEWKRSGVRADDGVPTFAVERDGRPVAATQYRIADGTAGIAVVSRPAYRGEGNATLAVSAATAHALDAGLVPEYRTLEEWSSSVALAERLGFERVGVSLLVRLDETE